jgi:hypothetical protein
LENMMAKLEKLRSKLESRYERRVSPTEKDFGCSQNQLLMIFHYISVDSDIKA